MRICAISHGRIAGFNDILSEPGIYDRMRAHGYAIREAIEKAAKDHGKTLATTGTGTAFHVHFGLETAPKSYRDVMRADRATGERFRANKLQHGIYNLPGGRWYVGASHSDTELLQVKKAVIESMKGI
jgi:glutamate-1-semialdehyde aminotransferase